MIRAVQTSYSYLMQHVEATLSNENDFNIAVHRTAGMPKCRLNLSTLKHDVSLPLSYDELQELAGIVKTALADWDYEGVAEAPVDEPPF